MRGNFPKGKQSRDSSLTTCRPVPSFCPPVGDMSPCLSRPHRRRWRRAAGEPNPDASGSRLPLGTVRCSFLLKVFMMQPVERADLGGASKAGENFQRRPHTPDAAASSSSNVRLIPNALFWLVCSPPPSPKTISPGATRAIFKAQCSVSFVMRRKHPRVVFLDFR